MEKQPSAEVLRSRHCWTQSFGKVSGKRLWWRNCIMSLKTSWPGGLCPIIHRTLQEILQIVGHYPIFFIKINSDEQKHNPHMEDCIMCNSTKYFQKPKLAIHNKGSFYIYIYIKYKYIYKKLSSCLIISVSMVMIKTFKTLLLVTDFPQWINQINYHHIHTNNGWTSGKGAFLVNIPSFKIQRNSFLPVIIWP